MLWGQLGWNKHEHLQIYCWVTKEDDYKLFSVNESDVKAQQYLFLGGDLI